MFKCVLLNKKGCPPDILFAIAERVVKPVFGLQKGVSLALILTKRVLLFANTLLGYFVPTCAKFVPVSPLQIGVLGLYFVAKRVVTITNHPTSN